MRVLHVLRKFDPAEWGGTEAAVSRLFDGLRQQGVTPVMYCPRINGNGHSNGDIKRFKVCVPAWGVSREKKRQLITLGGNLMSFDLLPALWRERDAALVHTHTLGRLGGIASTVARKRRLPFVVSIHGGLLDVPEGLKSTIDDAPHDGIEWGKIFGLLFRARELIEDADAVFTCNPREAELLREKHPDKRVEIQPHGVSLDDYQKDHRATAREAFPQIRGREVLLCVGRIDPVKNQGWLLAQVPEIFRAHPGAMLVLTGACTNANYGNELENQIRQLGIGDRVLITGGLPPGDARLIGLFQESRVVLLPSNSETFGLVLLEAWAAGTTVISSRTSGAAALVRDGENGWLFDLAEPAAFHRAVNDTLRDPVLRSRLAETGQRLVRNEYDVKAIGRRVKNVYEELIESKHALRHSA
jgi:glycosyltransferase involved in cell wall biosynthesis